MKQLFNLLLPNFDFIILQSLAITLTAILLPRLKIKSFSAPVMTAVALSWINDIYWDSGLFYSVPTSLSTDTLTLLVMNGLIFWIIIKLIPGIEIRGILTPIYSAVIFTCCSMLAHKYGSDINWTEVIQNIFSLLDEVKMRLLDSKDVGTTNAG